MHRSASSPPALRDLGLVEFGTARALQEELRDALLRGEGEEALLLLEHPDVITLGRATRPDSLLHSQPELERRGYDVQSVNRGGDVTFHGPGQLVGYPILDLARRGRDVHRYLRQLETVLIDTAADFGVAAKVRPGFTGVWVDDEHKLASIGIGVRRWITLHGFALNVNTRLERFESIVPCGLSGVRMVNLEDLAGSPVPMQRVRERVSLHLEKAFA